MLASQIMNKKQTISAWVYAVLWMLTLAVAGMDNQIPDFTDFLRVCIIFGVFAALTHHTLRTR